MTKTFVMTVAFLLASQSAFAGSSLFVGNLGDAQVSSIYHQAVRLGARSASMHRFGHDLVLKISIESPGLYQRILDSLARANPSQNFESEGGPLYQRVNRSRLHNVRFERPRGMTSDLLSISHSAARHDYHLLSSKESTLAFFRTCRAPSDSTLRAARLARAQFESKLDVYPADEIPQAYIHCSQLGICWCEGNGSCNNLISACVEANANWGCTQYDRQGACVSGACSI